MIMVKIKDVYLLIWIKHLFILTWLINEHITEAKRILIKNTRGEKIILTVFLAITSDGSKLPVYLVFKKQKG